MASVSKLTPDQEKELMMMATDPSKRILLQDLVDFVEKQHGIKYSKSGMHYLLKRNGYIRHVRQRVVLGDNGKAKITNSVPAPKPLPEPPNIGETSKPKPLPEPPNIGETSKPKPLPEPPKDDERILVSKSVTYDDIVRENLERRRKEATIDTMFPTLMGIVRDQQES